MRGRHRKAGDEKGPRRGKQPRRGISEDGCDPSRWVPICITLARLLYDLVKEVWHQQSK